MNDFRVKSQESRLGKNRTAKDNSGASDVALRGAALAFGNGKPPVRPKPLVHNPPRTNGALAAATLAEHEGAGSRRPRSNLRTSEDVGLDQRLAYQNTGSSVGSRTSRADLHRRNSTQLQMARSNYLQPPGIPALDQSRSASFIAATLAASRSASISPNATGPAQFQTSPQGRFGVSKTPSVRSIKSTDSSGKGSDPLDTRSIPPTTSLIGMFEQNAASPQTVKWPGTNKTGTTNAIRSSRPGEASSLSPRGHTPSPSSETPRKPAVALPKPALPKPAPPTMALHAPEAPGTSKTTKPPILAKKPSIAVASKPVPIPSKSPASDPRQKDASSDDSFVSASDIQQMSPRPSSEYKPSFRAELNSQKANRLRSPSQISIASEQMKIESMANAIVASSLASSRATSASPSTNSLHGPNQHQPSVPPSHRNVHSRHHLFHNSRDNSRASSPAKAQGMRMTMRKDRQEETDEGEKRRGKKNLVKKHPNKHHEGDRKRWRDVITERERKRYEAVWASNRGLYTSYPLQGRKTSGTEDMEVCNLVVRDIWSRSKIHDDVLEEVYELVDRSSSGSLDKVEFVVGMWLVDQWLKGRKLPVRVGDSVWKSVGALNGLKVKIWA